MGGPQEEDPLGLAEVERAVGPGGARPREVESRMPSRLKSAMIKTESRRVNHTGSTHGAMMIRAPGTGCSLLSLGTLPRYSSSCPSNSRGSPTYQEPAFAAGRVDMVASWCVI